MLKVTHLCPAPRDLVIIYADPPKSPGDVDEDTVFIREEDAAALAYIESGRTSGVVVLATTPGGQCIPAADTEGFMGVVWSDNAAEKAHFNELAKKAYMIAIGKERPTP